MSSLHRRRGERGFHRRGDHGLSFDRSSYYSVKGQCRPESSLSSRPQDRLIECLKGGLPESTTGVNGADDGGEHHRPRRVHGRSGGGFKGEKEFRRGDHSERKDHSDQSPLSADPDVRLLHGLKVIDSGAGNLFDAVLTL